MLVNETMYCNLLGIYPELCCNSQIDVHFHSHICRTLFHCLKIQYLFNNFAFFRSELDDMPENSICDVIGVLVFVGRVQRLKKKGKLLILKVIKSISVNNSVFICALSVTFIYSNILSIQKAVKIFGHIAGFTLLMGLPKNHLQWNCFLHLSQKSLKIFTQVLSFNIFIILFLEVGALT